MSVVRLARIGAASSILLVATSCSRGPSAVRAPDIDPSGAGSAAMELYDADGDGKIAGPELDKAPALKFAIKRLDTDSDGGASADEIAARIEAWKATKIGLTSFGFTATIDGSPLTDAEVVFEPEAFQGEDIQSATATTNTFGGGSGSIPKEQRPSPSSPPGMQLGFYKVKITKPVNGKESIPAKYNTETILGVECAPDVPEILNQKVIFPVTTK